MVGSGADVGLRTPFDDCESGSVLVLRCCGVCRHVVVAEAAVRCGSANARIAVLCAGKALARLQDAMKRISQLWIGCAAVPPAQDASMKEW